MPPEKQQLFDRWYALNWEGAGKRMRYTYAIDIRQGSEDISKWKGQYSYDSSSQVGGHLGVFRECPSDDRFDFW